MCKSIVLPLFAVLAISVCPVSGASAAEIDSLPPQVPARTASGAANITDVWLHNGGGRLYWNTLVTPRQVALEGAHFVDPAAMPELALTPPAGKKAPVRHTRKAKPAKVTPADAASAAPNAAPKGVGKTSLKAPASNGSAIPSLSAAGASPAPAGGSGLAGADSPYSSGTVSPVGGVGGSSATQGAGMPSSGGQGAVAVPAISADDILPRANARP